MTKEEMVFIVETRIKELLIERKELSDKPQPNSISYKRKLEKIL